MAQTAQDLPTDVIEAMDLLDARSQEIWDKLAETRDQAQAALSELSEFRQLLTKIRITALVKQQAKEEEAR